MRMDLTILALITAQNPWRAAFVLLLGGTVTLLGLRALPKIWRGDADVFRMLHTGFDHLAPFGARGVQALIRGFPAAISAMTVLVAGVAVGTVGWNLQFPLPSGPRRVAVTCLLSLSMALFVAHFVVLLFNRPKFLVPPKLRHEDGLIGRRRASDTEHPRADD